MTCPDCGRPVDGIAAALTSKLVGPHATQFRCLDCLAASLATSRESLLAAASRYQRGGCQLFRGLALPPTSHDGDRTTG